MSSKQLFGILRRTLLRTCFITIRIQSRCYGKQKTPATEDLIIKSPYKALSIEHNSLDEYMWSKLERWPSKAALVCSETDRTLSYMELRRDSTQIGRAMRWMLKLRKGAVVAVILPNIIEFPVIILGALHADVIVTCINPVSSKDEITQQLTHSKAKVVFVTNQMGCWITTIAKNLPNKDIRIVCVNSDETASVPESTMNFKDLLDHDLPRVDVKADLDDVFIMPFSNGTTGSPKGVELTQKNVMSNIMQIQCPELKLNRNTSQLQEIVPAILPFSHVYGLVIGCLNLLNEGVKLVMIPKFRRNTFQDFLLKYRPTSLYCSGTLVTLCYNLVTYLTHFSGINPELLQSLHYICSGASPLGPEDVKSFQGKTGGRIRLVQGYGLTECSPLTHMQSLKENPKPGSVGKLVPNTECKIVSVDYGARVALGPNKNGEILIRGPQVMKGYFQERESTASVIVDDGWLRTGDIGYYDEDFNFFITDRLKSIIKVKGFTVVPGELEELLRRHQEVADAAVIGKPHPQLGEVPKAFVVPKNKTTICLEEIHSYVNDRVSEFKQLRGGISVVDEIPRDSTGQIVKNDLKHLK